MFLCCQPFLSCRVGDKRDSSFAFAAIAILLSSFALSHTGDFHGTGVGREWGWWKELRGGGGRNRPIGPTRLGTRCIELRVDDNERSRLQCAGLGRLRLAIVTILEIGLARCMIRTQPHFLPCCRGGRGLVESPAPATSLDCCPLPLPTVLLSGVGGWVKSFPSAASAFFAEDLI